MFSDNCLFLSGNKNFESITFPFFYRKNCDFIKALSKSLLNDINARKYPEIVKFAFWSRAANLDKIYNSFDKNILRFGRGTCLHILPRNTSINFAYSLIFGLLSGNSNILRVPKVDSLVKIITSKINQILSKRKFQDIKKSICIISYDSKTNITQNISSTCDVRLLWGGDQTISSIKKIEAQPNCIDITFPDRYSVTIINSERVNIKNVKNLVNNFYNDSFFMDQNACSSPHLVLWYYKDKKKLYNNKNLFWNYLSNHIKKNYKPEDAILYQKYVRYCENFLNYNKMIKNSSGIFKNLYITKLKNLNFDITKMRGLAGTFYEYDIVNLNEIKKIMNYKLQTINYFGLNKKNFIQFFSKPIEQKGILRIVKVGKALDMSHIWDGYNIIDLMSKTIELD
jgi:hypothetical protein